MYVMHLNGRTAPVRPAFQEIGTVIVSFIEVFHFWDKRTLVRRTARTLLEHLKDGPRSEMRAIANWAVVAAWDHFYGLDGVAEMF